MIRRLVLAALLLAVAGCTTYGGYYRDDYGYYDGYGGDDAYYDEPYYDGYGAYPYDYTEYYDYGGSPWGLGRYSRCSGWYGCSPGYGGYWSWNLSYGSPWYSPWSSWHGAWWPLYAYDWYRPHRPHRPHRPDRPDREEDVDQRVVTPKPPHEDNRLRPRPRSAPGEYVWPGPPSSRGVPRPGGGSTAPRPSPGPGPATPTPKPRPDMGIPPNELRVRTPMVPAPAPAPRAESRPEPRREASRESERQADRPAPPRAAARESRRASQIGNRTD